MIEETQTAPANPIDTDDNGNPVATQSSAAPLTSYPTDDTNWPAGIAEELAAAKEQIAAIEAAGSPADHVVESDNMIEPALSATDVLEASAAGRAAAATVGNAEIEENFAPALHAAKGAVEEANDLAEVEVPQEQPEDFGEVAFEADEHAVETVVEKAETLASEAAPEREKVWNIHLQAWV